MYQDNMRQGLYDPSLEHDNCGIGAIVNIKGKKTHSTVAGALSIVEQLEHRAGKDAEGKMKYASLAEAASHLIQVLNDPEHITG